MKRCKYNRKDFDRVMCERLGLRSVGANKHPPKFRASASILFIGLLVISFILLLHDILISNNLLLYILGG